MDTIVVGLDRLFERAQIVQEADGWTPVEIPEVSAMDLCLSRLEISQDVALLCAQYEVNLPMSIVTVMVQPEVYWNPNRPADNMTVACGIEKIMAPGDDLTTNPLKELASVII